MYNNELFSIIKPNNYNHELSYTTACKKVLAIFLQNPFGEISFKKTRFCKKRFVVLKTLVEPKNFAKGGILLKILDILNQWFLIGGHAFPGDVRKFSREREP